jgi:hypothetical protein
MSQSNAPWSVFLPLTTCGGILSIPNIEIGNVAYGSLGTSTTDVDGQLWITDIFVPFSKRITKIAFLQGATATTDKTLVALYDAAGNLLSNSAVAGVTLSGANTFQEQTLLTPLDVYGPTQLYVAVQGNGTTAGALRLMAASTYVNRCTGSIAGTFGTVPATITVPTTFVATKGPIVYLA